MKRIPLAIGSLIGGMVVSLLLVGLAAPGNIVTPVLAASLGLYPSTTLALAQGDPWQDMHAACLAGDYEAMMETMRQIAPEEMQKIHQSSPEDMMQRMGMSPDSMGSMMGGSGGMMRGMMGNASSMMQGMMGSLGGMMGGMMRP